MAGGAQVKSAKAFTGKNYSDYCNGQSFFRGQTTLDQCLESGAIFQEGEVDSADRAIALFANNDDDLWSPLPPSSRRNPFGW
jgi:hypothetical protein